MSRPFVSGLRGRLLLLIVLATLPAFALTFFTGWRDRQRQRAEVASDTVRLVRLIAADQERIVDGTRQILSDLAQVPEVREGDPTRSRTFFAILMKQYRGYASFTVLSPSGDVLVSLPRSSEPVNFSDRGWFQEAAGRRRFAVGDYQVGHLTKTAVLVAAWPVINAEGVLVSVITAALDVEWLNEIAATSQLPPGAVLMLVDRKGQVIARHPEGEGWIGRYLPNPTLSAGMKAQAEGVVEASDPDAVGRIYAFTPIRGRANTELRRGDRRAARGGLRGGERPAGAAARAARPGHGRHAGRGLDRRRARRPSARRVAAGRHAQAGGGRSFRPHAPALRARRAGRPGARLRRDGRRPRGAPGRARPCRAGPPRERGPLPGLHESQPRRCVHQGRHRTVRIRKRRLRAVPRPRGGRVDGPYRRGPLLPGHDAGPARGRARRGHLRRSEADAAGGAAPRRRRGALADGHLSHRRCRVAARRGHGRRPHRLASGARGPAPQRAAGTPRWSSRPPTGS